MSLHASTITGSHNKLGGNKKLWISELCDDISNATKEDVGRDRLIAEFLEFRRNTSDNFLRESYPPEQTIKRSWTGASEAAPRKGGHDFIMSFLDSYYPGVSTRVGDVIISKISKSINNEKPKTEMGRILAKETYRRGSATKSALKKSYWESVSDHVNEKYAGCYLLIRLCGDDTIAIETMSLKRNPHLPNLLTVYWVNRHDQKWTGDLYINPNKFIGLTARASTDQMIEPVTLCLLRAPRMRFSDKADELFLAGKMDGWVDNSDEQIVSSRIAAWKIPDLKSPQTLDSFHELTKAKTVLKRIARIETLSESHRKILTSYFGKKGQKTSRLDARDQLKVFLDYHK